MSKRPNTIAITGWGLVEIEAADEPLSSARLSQIAELDSGLLRKLDRFGAMGFLAGSLALAHAGFRRPEQPDPRSGAILGTAFGCRDSIVEHAKLLESAITVTDLGPAVFAQTVHNSASGALAIAWNLGGVSEVVASGRCGGLDALALGFRRIESGAADRVVAGGAEGLNAATRRAARLEWGTSLRELPMREAAAALVLEREEASIGRERARLADVVSFFEPQALKAGTRLRAWLASVGSAALGPVLLATPDDEYDALGTPGAAGVQVERFGASGPVAVLDVLEAGVPEAGVAVVARDRSGMTAAVFLRPPRS